MDSTFLRSQDSVENQIVVGVGGTADDVATLLHGPLWSLLSPQNKKFMG
jgi:hypothetical protein